MAKAFTEEFLKTFDDVIFPEEITSQFEVISCLSQSSISTTYLLEEKKDRKLHVLKCQKKLAFDRMGHEADILMGISHKGIPTFDLEIETDDNIFILREYIEGISLDEYIEEHHVDEIQIINIAVQLCDILYFLHTQPSPIIHRDIKPSNIIINTKNNDVTLIDFGISRKYSKNADADTVFFGTEKFAPPEQYGFSQTDCRTDIYSLGVLLHYMFTGTIDQKIRIKNKNIECIVKKCMEFSPKERFQNALSLKKALLMCQSKTRKKLIKYIALGFVFFVIFAAGIFTGRYTDFLLPDENKTEDNIVFTEPLVENAVRLMLGKNENDTISSKELLEISSLYIAGENAAVSQDDWENIRNEIFTNTNKNPYGSLISLEDLKKMPNLRELFIFAQPLSDLSPLSETVHLESLNLMHCNVSDVSQLVSLKMLKYLFLFDNPIEDFSSFSKMKFLKDLGLGHLSISKIDELGDISHIKRLDFHLSTLESLEGIEKLQKLTAIRLTETLVKDFSPLNSLTYIKDVTISPDMQIYLDTLANSNVKITIEE